MGKTIKRGKQQIMFNYLPGKTFDFGGSSIISRVRIIKGVENKQLNSAIVINKIAEEISAWSEEFRPGLKDHVLSDTSRFILLDPKSVQAEFFPRVFWCQNIKCGRVFDWTNNDILPNNNKCPACGNGKLIQLRFIKIHNCGAIEPLIPYFCNICNSSSNMALDTRGSERISNFRWLCRSCGNNFKVLAGVCRHCGKGNMSIEVHRAGKTYYPHSTVLLNQPGSEMSSFLRINEWPFIAASLYFGLPETKGKKLHDFFQLSYRSNNNIENETGITYQELEDLMQKQSEGQLTAEQVFMELKLIKERRLKDRKNKSPEQIKQKLIERTGVPDNVWIKAGQEILESVMPTQAGKVEDVFENVKNPLLINSAQRLGTSKLSLVKDFPITIATYGYSREKYRPNECRINPFPPDREYNGKIPIYVDLVQADALLITLDHKRVINWLVENNYSPAIPPGTDSELAQKSYFVKLFDNISYNNSITGDNPEARLVFGLLHTMSHISIRQASLLCGLDRTSLSEYLLPKTLSFAIYCNHRSGATIGALVSLFEQSISELIYEIRNSRHCVYDPVCLDNKGSCHACTHLAETSCKHFNLNLGRAFLFGGNDPILGNIKGYFEISV